MYFSYNRLYIGGGEWVHNYNLGCIINYTSDKIIKVYKAGISNTGYKTINTTTNPIQLWVCSSPVSIIDMYNISEIYSSDIKYGANNLSGVIHGRGGVLYNASADTGLSAYFNTRSILRRLIFGSNPPVNNVSFRAVNYNTHYHDIENFQCYYEHSDSDTQPITLRNGQGIFFINVDAINQGNNANCFSFFEFDVE